MRLLIALLLSSSLFSVEHLPEEYLVRFGSLEAPLEVVEYFSFSCPNCVALFRKEFPELRERYLEKGLISLTFHPVPMDLVTVQAMDCLQKLSEGKKRIFLEAVLDSIDIRDPELATEMLKRAMELLESPLPELANEEYLSSTKAFRDAYEYILEEDKPNAIPSLTVGGTFYPNEIPSLHFLEKKLKGAP